ncbi:MAG: outer membrane beta-barrel protein [Saprospiraceae bacterium]
MKNLLLPLFLCLPLFLLAQSNSKIELLGSLDYSYRHHGNSGIVQSVRSSEKGKLNYHFQLNYHQKLKEKIWLKIGLGLASAGYNSEIIELRYGSQHDGQGGFNPVLTSDENIQTKYTYQFLVIPIALRYDFLQKKLKPFVEIGLNTNYYLRSITSSFTNGDKSGSRKERENQINQIQLAPTLAFGVSYQINEKWEFVAQPNFTYHLTPTYKESSDLSASNGLVKEYQWSAGLALGLRMDLK